MQTYDITKPANIQQIADKGIALYEKLKSRYEANEKGKFLAIEVDSGKAYLGLTGADALETARKNHPDKIFYLVKIGFDFAESMAEYFTGEH